MFSKLLFALELDLRQNVNFSEITSRQSFVKGKDY